MWLIIPLLLVAHVFVCLLLVGAVLMQLPRSEGLGAAFGGGVTENLFGAQTTNVLAKFTVWLGIAFFGLTLLLAVAYAHDKPSASKLEKDLLGGTPAAQASPAPSVAPTATPAPSPDTTEAATQPAMSAAPTTPVSAIAATPAPEAAAETAPAPAESPAATP